MSIDTDRYRGAVDESDGDDGDAAFNRRINAHVTPTVDDPAASDDDGDHDYYDGDGQEHPDGECDDEACCPPAADRDDTGATEVDDQTARHDHDRGDAVITAAAPNGPPRFDRRVAWGIGGLAAAAAVAVLGGAVVFYSGGDEKRPAQSHSSLGDPQAVAVATPAPSADPTVAVGADRPLPYTADAAESCPAGSTAAQTMAGADPRNAFVCVRNGLDGQVIDIDLGKTYVITAISLTPGWVGLDASGVSQWGQHRVITTVQYRFNDTDRTLITQQTGNVHGEAVQPVKRVLASKIQLLIRQTSRPPAEPATAAPTGGGGGLTSVFGEAAPTVPPLLPPATGDVLGSSSSPSNSDPVDATFAISNFKVIGHEAI